MKTFIFTLQNDQGVEKLQTTAQNEAMATFIIMQAERCPMSAIINVEEVKP